MPVNFRKRLNFTTNSFTQSRSTDERGFLGAGPGEGVGLGLGMGETGIRVEEFVVFRDVEMFVRFVRLKIELFEVELMRGGGGLAALSKLTLTLSTTGPNLVPAIGCAPQKHSVFPTPPTTGNSNTSLTKYPETSNPTP